ncbi:MAG: T9SS type A sorting domain-containing protein, partial [bacterium]
IKDIELLGVGGIDNSGPKIATNFGKLIDFGKVKKATSKTVDLKIFNDGDKELTIQQFKMDLTMPDNDRFTFAQGMNYPFFVKVKDSVTVKVKFAATIDEERVYNGKIIVECDAKNDPQFSIDLKGEIGPFVGVDEPIAVTGENFSMNISPNPASDNSELTCNLQNGSAKMNLYLTDLSGAKLMQISQTVMNSVEQKFSISTQALANGKYFVVAEIDGKTFVTNFIVSK